MMQSRYPSMLNIRAIRVSKSYNKIKEKSMSAEHYKVITSTNIEKFEVRVDEMLSDGWQLLGSVIIAPTIGGGSLMFIQSMFK